MADGSGRVAVVGACGRMGEQVRKWVGLHDELRVVAALEASGHSRLGESIEPGVTLGDDLRSALANSDVVIDFSVPGATLGHLRVAAEMGVAYVTGTTGFDAQQRRELEALSERVPLLHAPNFSVSVNVLAWLARAAAEKLGSGFDVELFELHHSAKRDAPSGTALLLAEAVAQGQGQPLRERLVLERAGEIGARPQHAIGIQSLRGGDNPGDHSVLFLGQGERLELTHRSFTRDHFARGAVRAAAWLIGRPAGRYSIEQVLGLERLD